MHSLDRSTDPMPPGVSGLPARALLGWMSREQAVRFLRQDCLFSTPLSECDAEQLWRSFKTIVDNLPEAPLAPPRNMPLSAADLKAVRKFRNRHSDSDFVVDFAKVDATELTVHQLWISTAVAGKYRGLASDEEWIDIALLNPPSSSQFRWRWEGQTLVFDLPHAEFFLAGPLQPHGQLQLAQARAVVTVWKHEDRLLLTGGYHRTFARIQAANETPNAPRGVLFAVSRQLALLGTSPEEIMAMMRGGRPPRMADFFDDRVFLPVTLRRKRYQARVNFELKGIDAEEAGDAGF